MLFCSKCGNEILEASLFCNKCGYELVLNAEINVANNQSIQENKNNGPAIILSFLFPGLGQLYKGQLKKGFIYMIVQIVLIALSSSFVDVPGGWGIIFILGAIALFLWITSIFDAKK